MYQIRFDFENPGGDRALDYLEELASALVELNVLWFEDHPDAPGDLVVAGVRYVDPMLCPSRTGKSDDLCQTILSAGQVLAKRKGTCIDLCAYYAGLWRNRMGTRSFVRIIRQKDHYGQPLAAFFHAVVDTNGVEFDAQTQVQNRLPMGRAA